MPENKYYSSIFINFLPCNILESKPYNDDIKRGQFRPFERDAIVICSYQFARNKAADVHALRWDLVVIDEAHRLRNVYKPGNIIANTLKQALAHRQRVRAIRRRRRAFGLVVADARTSGVAPQAPSGRRVSVDNNRRH